MPKDDRDLLEVLKRELDFLELGGYRTNVHQPWRPQFIFEDSPTCLNRGIQENRTPCTECVLISLVPLDQRKEKFPCRQIPLTEAGASINYFYHCGTQEELDAALAEWLRKTIHRLEEEKAQKTEPVVCCKIV